MTRRDAPWIALVLSAQIGIASAARATTTVHTYTYNVDGALTSVTTQVNNQASTTTYLTWDDFTPDAATPTTGTVSAGDGRLLGYGPSPDNLTARFAFDPRDRLLSYSGAAGSETYDYYANSMMRSSSTDADDRRFYYDASDNAQAVNLHDAAANRWVFDERYTLPWPAAGLGACTHRGRMYIFGGYSTDNIHNRAARRHGGSHPG